MKDWDVHGYNDSVCNAFVEPPRTNDMDNAKANLERWLFYYDRFNNHEVSAKLESELLKRTQEKMTEMQETSTLTWIEVCRAYRSGLHCTYCINFPTDTIHAEGRR